jgi:hypothetical protein
MCRSSERTFVKFWPRPVASRRWRSARSTSHGLTSPPFARGTSRAPRHGSWSKRCGASRKPMRRCSPIRCPATSLAALRARSLIASSACAPPSRQRCPTLLWRSSSTSLSWATALSPCWRLFSSSMSRLSYPRCSTSRLRPYRGGRVLRCMLFTTLLCQVSQGPPEPHTH